MANAPLLVQPHAHADLVDALRRPARPKRTLFDRTDGPGGLAFGASIAVHLVLGFIGVSAVNAAPAAPRSSELHFVIDTSDPLPLPPPAESEPEPQPEPDPEVPEAARTTARVARPVAQAPTDSEAASPPPEEPRIEPAPAALADPLLTAGNDSSVTEDAPSGSRAAEGLSRGLVSGRGQGAVGLGSAAAVASPSPPAAPTQRRTIDVRELRRRWLAGVSQTILRQAARDYSQRSRRRHEEGTVRVRLTVSRAGQIDSAAIAASSGYAALDRAALNAVQSVGRVPAPPVELAWADRPIVVPVVYRLQ
jgi:periplasmic protein TonB